MEDVQDVVALMIPILAIGLGIGIAYWSIYWEHQKKRLQYEERRLMIERGMMPPPELPEEKKKVTPEDCLRRGAIMLFLGMGFGMGYFILRASPADGPPAWLLGVAGAIVGLLGLGNLVYYLIAKSRKLEVPRTGIEP